MKQREHRGPQGGVEMRRSDIDGEDLVDPFEGELRRPCAQIPIADQ